MKSIAIKNLVVRFLYSTILLLLPIATALFIIHYVAHSGLKLYFPRSSDEIVFWIDAKSFFNVGFHGGYSGYEELLGFAPLLGIGTYGAHGIVPPMLTSLVAHFLDFTPFIAINLSNWIYLVLATLFFVLTWQGRNESILFTALFLCTSFTFIEFYTVDWQETLHVSIALALVSVFSNISSGNNSRRKRFVYFMTGVIILTIASSLRYSWGVLFIPLFIFYNFKTKKDLIKSIVLGGSLMAAAYVMYGFVAAPYPYGEYGTIYIKKMLHGELPIWKYLDYITLNIKSIFLLSRANPAPQLDVLVALAVILCLLILPLTCRKTIKNIGVDESLPFKLFIFHIFNVVFLFVLCILWYQPSIRLIAPNYILSVLLMVRFVPSRKYFLIILVNLILLPLNLEGLRDYLTFTYPTPQEYSFLVDKFQSTGLGLGKYMTYQKDADPWCNTVLVQEWSSELLYLPPGIATHYYREIGKKTLPFKARYIYLGLEQLSSYEKISNSTHLRELWEGPLGTLYLNADSNCN
jgi:hypothetical protein